jgi:hypothetical protein
MLKYYFCQILLKLLFSEAGTGKICTLTSLCSRVRTDVCRRMHVIGSSRCGWRITRVCVRAHFREEEESRVWEECEEKVIVRAAGVRVSGNAVGAHATQAGGARVASMYDRGFCYTIHYRTVGCVSWKKNLFA